MKENLSHPYKAGDWAVITDTGSGTSNVDIGIVFQIEEINSDNFQTPQMHNYPIKMDRDKIGNNDRYTHPRVMRFATEEEILKAGGSLSINYQIF